MTWIRLLGPPRIESRGATPPQPRGRKALAATAYLALQADGTGRSRAASLELLHKSNCDRVVLVAALHAGDVQEAVEVSRKHVDILHRTMFMGLADGGATSSSV